MNEAMEILYVGSLPKGTTSLQRMEATRDLGHSVTPIDTCPPAIAKREWGLLYRLRSKLLGPADLAGANRQMLEAAARRRFDVAWIDKGLAIAPQTLRELKRLQPSCRIAGYSPDDMMNPNNQSRRFLGGLGLYDIYFTTKSFGVAELKQLGCPRVEFIGNAYDPHTHRPMTLTDEERRTLGGPVGFIGGAERERAWTLARLASQMPVKIWGNEWDSWQRKTKGRYVVAGPSQYGDAYAKIICAFDINLCFLRKCNRDLQTQRSVEVPACGAFMLAERTDEHLDLFEEGKEAEYFSTEQEMTEKIRYYIAHPQERMAIAAAGRQRCLRSGYSYQERMRTMLDIVARLQ